MPTIPPDVLDCSIYLYADSLGAKHGEEAGGTGFLVWVPLPGTEAGTVYAVSNAHVVAAGFSTIRLNTAEGGHDSIVLNDGQWTRHPNGDDLAIAEVTLSSDFRFKAISSDSFVDGYDQTMFAVGQEVCMVGRYVNHEGRQRNRPTVRFGHIAQLPYERIRTDSGIEQEGFLVDMRSLSGYSGSPVFVYRARPDLDTDAERWITSYEHRFLGIDFGHLRALSPVLAENRRDRVDPRMWAEQNSGMAAVIPAWKLTQVLFDDEDVVKARQEGERAWLEANPQEGDPPA